MMCQLIATSVAKAARLAPSAAKGAQDGFLSRAFDVPTSKRSRTSALALSTSHAGVLSYNLNLLTCMSDLTLAGCSRASRARELRCDEKSLWIDALIAPFEQYCDIPIARQGASFEQTRSARLSPWQPEGHVCKVRVFNCLHNIGHQQLTVA